MTRFISILLATACLTACSYPTSRTTQGTHDGFFKLSGMPADAHVILDGQDVGAAASYQGETALSVKPGTHRVVVSQAGRTLLDKKYYVDAGVNVMVRND